MQATGLLILLNLIFIYVVVKLQDLGSMILLGVIVGMALILTLVLSYIANANKTKTSK